jgi:outer membrane receptor protein involved in Fe transport
MVGTVISGFEIVRQDAAGLVYIAQDARPIGTRVNVDRARLLGLDLQGTARVGRHLNGTANFSMTNGRLLATGEYLRRMPPPLGGARLRWETERVWIEGAMNFARTQTRFNSGDSTDARIGAARTKTSIASFFNGTATDMGLVRNGTLVATGETLAQVQTRLLGTATSAPLFTDGPGYVVFGLRAGVRISRALDVSLLGENLTDRNYRMFGSGLDASGINFQLRTRVRF